MTREEFVSALDCYDVSILALYTGGARLDDVDGTVRAKLLLPRFLHYGLVATKADGEIVTLELTELGCMAISAFADRVRLRLERRTP